MTQAPPQQRRRLVDLAPLRVPAFGRLWVGGAIAGIGAQMTIVAVGLQIFDMTHSTLAVGLVGGIALLPMIIAGLWGGVLADAFDRRTVLIVSSIVAWLGTLSLLGLSLADTLTRGTDAAVPLWPFYLATTVATVAATISGATRAAVIPRILPADLIARAAALNGISIGAQLTLGPALAGVLVATLGFPVTFAVDAVLFTAGFLGIVMLPRLPAEKSATRAGLRSLRDGIDFLRHAPNIRSSFIVDIVAMTFGRPFALLPAVAALAVGGGAVTVGVLTAAAALGTFLTSLFSGPVAHVHRYGVAIARSIMVYGGCVALLGLVVGAMQTGWFGAVGADFGEVNVPALVLAALAMAGMGASDEVSAIFRSTMMLTATPDAMQGRLQGIFTVVVTGGPRIGDLYVGILATAVGLWFPPLLGGVLIIALIALIMRAQPSFRNYDARNPQP
ncbi:MFS transporter [Microterricola pindariensis]|uniref:MFS transporter n=1 Tax=Microterricola pindariensis TaxID=478010 RepID=UPI0018829C0A|nr:MFS transporter [Microterricola pindariensis]